ncbi:MAG: glycosyltransferase [Flavobacteriales bacterium]|nr:glycosyltransferase [Flavobacteriales bacterium]
MSSRPEERTVMERAGMVGVVDVVVPCFNDGAYLIEALSSLGSGRGKGEGVFIVNDGSTDAHTLDVLAGLRMRGFRVIDQENRGLSAARNTGWRACTAPCVLFLDADNKVDPALLGRATAVMDREPSVAVVYSDKLEFGGRDGIVEQPEVTLGHLLIGNSIDACAVVRREVLEALGGYDERMRDGYEDWELWIRAMAAGHGFRRIPEPLFSYRVREGSLVSRASRPDIRASIVAYVARKHEALFVQHAHTVVTELHRIQAHDRLLVLGAEKVASEAKASAAQALRAAREAGDALVVLRQDREEQQQAIGELHERLEQGDDALALAMEATRRTEAALEQLAREKDALASEAHRLVGEVDKALRALDVHREHGRALQALLGQYEERIKAIENSRLWRMRRAYHKMRALLRTGSSTSKKGFKWLRRITFLVSGKGRSILRKFLAKVFRTLYLWTEIRPVRILVGEEQLRAAVVDHADPYAQWMSRHFARPSDLQGYREDVPLLAYRPLVSIVMPVYQPPIELLDAAIRSVVDQVYPDIELCIADDRSPDPRVRKCLEEWKAKDPRIKVVYRTENGHISRASNSALELAAGEFTALMDHDDLLAPDAIYHIVKRLNLDRSLDLLYTDEDKIDESGTHSDPHFKPQWCPDHLLSRNYFGHLVVARTALLKDIGGFRAGFEGSQDYDLLLRLTERIEAGAGGEGRVKDRIAHIPRVLYHWRIHAGSAARGEDVKPYAYDAAKRALTEALDRRGEPAEVSFLYGFRGYDIRFTAPLKGKVSVIIPTKDKADILATCLRSLFALTDHPDFEVIVVSNNSTERSLFDLMKEMERAHGDRFRWFEHNAPFNFSGLMNEGTRRTKGEHILFLNNDTEIIHADWIRAMHAWSQRGSIGAVGAKLLYHNDTIQHGGVVIGLGGVAGHVFTGTHKDGPGYFNYVNTINNYSAVTAACMMVERTKLEAIGGWEELFTVEYNDVDLCLRLREKGWNNVYLPHVSLYHYESLTRGHPHMTKESYERHLREVGLFKERWKKYIDDDPCYNPNLSRGRHDWHFHL